MSHFSCQPGEIVVFSVTKSTPSPGPRAKDIRPSQGGENYTYSVDKFWVVQSVEENELLLVTRKGKEHRVSTDDPNLRKPGLWEKIVFRNRFRRLLEAYAKQTSSEATSPQQTSQPVAS